MESTIYDAIANERPLWERRQVQGHLGRFGFSGDEVQRTVGTLSGGERARVAMALLTLSTNNLLILDEPTNHLDVESIEVLEDAVDEYDGTVLIVSHDRAVLRGLATQVWELRHQELSVFPGTFVEWEAMRTERTEQETQQARADDRREAERNTRQREREREQRAREQGAGGDPKKLLRAAEKALADAELRVTTLEEKIAGLTAQLDDTSLYDNPAGIKKAAALGKELDDARDALEDAMHDWGSAEEYVSMLKTR
jgi:ATP-binding cassette subfamily F protein 3